MTSCAAAAAVVQHNRGLSVDLTSPADCRDYQAAIDALNLLQSNANFVQQSKEHRDALTRRSQADAHAYLAAIRSAAQVPRESPPPPVLHVTGTKGKGSTCIFAEALLRARGMRTGLFTSPHLIEVRERIRLDGRPIEKTKFAHYFWQVYDWLKEFTLKNCDEMGIAPDDVEAIRRIELDINGTWRPPLSLPTYFRFLTMMTFHVFWAEQVDVSIMEVGIGGRYDCTNAVDSKKLAVVVTSLGLDHVSMLGSTVEEIAWQKAGIMRPRCPAVTCQQPGSSLEVLKAEASSVGCPLWLCPTLELYGTPQEAPLKLGIHGEVQRINASLALQAVRFFLDGLNVSTEKQQSPHLEVEPSQIIQMASAWHLSTSEVQALNTVNWPGRHQIIVRNRAQLRFFLDGAHTFESIEHTARWFETVSGCADSRRYRVLIFNMTGERQPEVLLKSLATAGSGQLFNAAVFCPNVVHASDNCLSDLTYRRQNAGGSESRSTALAEIWSALMRQQSPSCTTSSSSNKALYFVCFSMEEALAWIEGGAGRQWIKAEEREESGVDVLITGSLHLVGCALKLLQPNLWQ